MQNVTASVETETKDGAPYWTERHGLGHAGPLPASRETYEGRTAQVEAESVRVSVSPEYDGVWVYVRADGLELRLQIRPDGSATVEDTMGEAFLCLPSRG